MDDFQVGTGFKKRRWTGAQSLQRSTGICNKETVGTNHIKNIS